MSRLPKLLPAVLAFGIVLAQAQEAPAIRAGQNVTGQFVPQGSNRALTGQFAVSEVRGNTFTGQFSGHLCGPNVYGFQGRIEGDRIEVTSTSAWGPIRVSARRVGEGRFEGTFSTSRVPGKVALVLSP